MNTQQMLQKFIWVQAVIITIRPNSGSSVGLGTQQFFLHRIGRIWVVFNVSRTNFAQEKVILNGPWVSEDTLSQKFKLVWVCLGRNLLKRHVRSLGLKLAKFQSKLEKKLDSYQQLFSSGETRRNLLAKELTNGCSYFSSHSKLKMSSLEASF